MNKEKAVKQGIFEDVLKLRDVESWPTWECEVSEQEKDFYLPPTQLI